MDKTGRNEELIKLILKVIEKGKVILEMRNRVLASAIRQRERPGSITCIIFEETIMTQ